MGFTIHGIVFQFTEQSSARFICVAHSFLHPSETGADGHQEVRPPLHLEAMAIVACSFFILLRLTGGMPEDNQNGVSRLAGPERSAD